MRRDTKSLIARLPAELLNRAEVLGPKSPHALVMRDAAAALEALTDAARELLADILVCDVGECDKPALRAVWGYGGQVTFCCDEHGPNADELRYATAYRRLAALLDPKEDS